MNYFLLIITIPFLFFLPGYCLTRIFFTSNDRIERFILSIFLSLALLYGGIFAIEKLAEKITAGKIAIVVLAMNVLCLVVASARLRQILQKMLRRFRGKDR